MWDVVENRYQEVADDEEKMVSQIDGFIKTQVKDKAVCPYCTEP